MGGICKLVIKAYSDSSFGTEKGEFTSSINPSNLRISSNVNYISSQMMGGANFGLRYDTSDPRELSFNLIFDNTGVFVDNSLTVKDQIANLQSVVSDFQKDINEPFYVRVIWGVIDFKGKLTKLNVEYTQFQMDGNPVRAEVAIAILESVMPSSSANKAKNKDGKDNGGDGSGGNGDNGGGGGDNGGNGGDGSGDNGSNGGDGSGDNAGNGDGAGDNDGNGGDGSGDDGSNGGGGSGDNGSNGGDGAGENSGNGDGAGGNGSGGNGDNGNGSGKNGAGENGENGSGKNGGKKNQQGKTNSAASPKTKSTNPVPGPTKKVSAAGTTLPKLNGGTSNLDLLGKFNALSAIRGVVGGLVAGLALGALGLAIPALLAGLLGWLFLKLIDLIKRGISFIKKLWNKGKEGAKKGLDKAKTATKKGVEKTKTATKKGAEKTKSAAKSTKSKASKSSSSSKSSKSLFSKGRKS